MHAPCENYARIWLGGLSDVTWRDLRRLDGTTLWVEVFRGRGRGTGMMAYRTTEEAAAALQWLPQALPGVQVDVWTSRSSRSSQCSGCHGRSGSVASDVSTTDTLQSGHQTEPSSRVGLIDVFATPGLVPSFLAFLQVSDWRPLCAMAQIASDPKVLATSLLEMFAKTKRSFVILADEDEEVADPDLIVGFNFFVSIMDRWWQHDRDAAEQLLQKIVDVDCNAMQHHSKKAAFRTLKLISQRSPRLQPFLVERLLPFLTCPDLLRARQSVNIIQGCFGGFCRCRAHDNLLKKVDSALRSMLKKRREADLQKAGRSITTKLAMYWDALQDQGSNTRSEKRRDVCFP
ncbi:unnamed protein product [Symbiodinium microadriaticum]|nr:unnamed protein product [Symbiodinium microadriaticum]CAE7938977.1 unnamed protein product [Symbiodinium sp. KB8]